MKDHMTERNIDVLENLESTRSAIDEIIAGEEVDRSTPAEVIAGIESAMREIGYLRAMQETQAAIIIDLQTRIERMIKLATEDNDTQARYAFEVIARLTTGGTHREKDEQALYAIGDLLKLIRSTEYAPERLRQASVGRDRSQRHGDDNIPF
jgi:hypothetical protein